MIIIIIAILILLAILLVLLVISLKAENETLTKQRNRTYELYKEESNRNMRLLFGDDDARDTSLIDNLPW